MPSNKSYALSNKSLFNKILLDKYVEDFLNEDIDNSSKKIPDRAYGFITLQEVLRENYKFSDHYKNTKFKKNNYMQELFYLCLENMLKDFTNVLNNAREINVPLPFTSILQQMFTALNAEGKGDEDYIAVIQILEKLAGITVKAHND